MKAKGEPTPLDNIPVLNDDVEKWFYSAYRNMKNLTGFEHHLSITDFFHYFSIYPAPFPKYVIISIIKTIDIKINNYNSEKRKIANKVKNSNGN